MFSDYLFFAINNSLSCNCQSRALFAKSGAGEEGIFQFKLFKYAKPI